MKTLYTLLLLLLPLAVFSQSEQPFKKANTIVIETGLTPEEAFTKWGRHLAQNGFAIGDSNKDFLTFSTGPKDTSRMNYAFVVNSSVDETGVITLKLQWQLKSSILAGTRATNYYDWEYATAKSNVQNIIHRDLLPTLQSFGSPVTYFSR